MDRVGFVRTKDGCLPIVKIDYKSNPKTTNLQSLVLKIKNQENRARSSDISYPKAT